MTMIVDNTMKGAMINGQGRGYVMRAFLRPRGRRAARLAAPVMPHRTSGVWSGPGMKVSSRGVAKYPRDFTGRSPAGNEETIIFLGFHVFLRREDAEAYAAAFASVLLPGRYVVVEVVFAEADVVAWGYEQWDHLVPCGSLLGDEKLPEAVVRVLTVTEQAWTDAMQQAVAKSVDDGILSLPETVRAFCAACRGAD